MGECILTILTPAYNAVAYLERYALGIHVQSDVSPELVIVDDGSNDGTFEKILSMKRQGLFGSAKCIVVRQANAGPHVAMNYGLQFATGDLILPVDADDMLLPGAVRAFVDAFATHPDADLVFADYKQVDEENRTLPVAASRKNWVRSPNLLYALLEHGMFIPAGAYCYRRRCLEYLPGGCFSREYCAQNLELLLHVAARGKHVYIPVETVQLTKRRRSRSNAKTLERLRRKVLGSHRLQRDVARRYRVPLQVRLSLERRLVPLELDYYFLSQMDKAFVTTWLKGLLLRVISRRNITQLLSLLIPRLRDWVIRHYFNDYDLTPCTC